MAKVSSLFQQQSICVKQSEFSEAKYAQLIAKKFNTDHHEIRLTPNDFLKELPNSLRQDTRITPPQYPNHQDIFQGLVKTKFKFTYILNLKIITFV